MRFVISSVCRPAYILCLHGSERCRPLSCRVLEHALPLASVCPKPGAPSLLDQHSHTLCARAGNGSADGSSNGFIVSNTVLTLTLVSLCRHRPNRWQLQWFHLPNTFLLLGVCAGSGSADGCSNAFILPDTVLLLDARAYAGSGSADGSSDDVILPQGSVLYGMDLASQEHMVRQ